MHSRIRKGDDIMKITINGHSFEWPSLSLGLLYSDFVLDINYSVRCACCGAYIDNPSAYDVQKACEGKEVFCGDDCEREAQRDDAEALRADEQFHKGL